jgi:xanthine/CO dehydrogenase XdhC/CoxF family maturation factor
MEFVFNFLKIFLVLTHDRAHDFLIPHKIVTFVYLFCALIASR